MSGRLLPKLPGARRSRPAALVFALFLLAMLALPPAAGAHAVLEGTYPERGAALSKSPGHVSFKFDENVEASFGAVKVFDGEGDQVQVGNLYRPGGDGTRVAIRVPADLPDGPYTATYRVVSADSHIVSSGFVFTVGKSGGESTKTISELLAGNGTGPVTDVGYWLARLAGFLAIGLAIGAFAFLLACWGPALRRGRRSGDVAAPAERRLARMLALAVAVGFVATALSIVFQTATAGGTSFWGALNADYLKEIAHTRFGTVNLLLMAAWLLCVPLVALSVRRAGSIWQDGWAAPAAAGLPLAFIALTPALAGHASTQGSTALLFPADVIHIGAMSVWGGGLACMIFALPLATARLDASGKTDLLTAVLSRFSTIALISVIALAVSGTVQAIIEVGSFGSLLDNAFGRTVLAKIAVLAVLVGIGAANRQRIVPALARAAARRLPPGGPGHAIRRNLRLETVLVVVAIGLAALLVRYAPPAETAEGPVSGSTQVGGDRLEYTVDPARIGSNQVHIYLFDNRTGAPVKRVLGVEADFSKPDSDVGAIDFDAERAGPGHFIVPKAMLAIRGTWKAEIWVRTSKFDENEAEFEFPIR